MARSPQTQYEEAGSSKLYGLLVSTMMRRCSTSAKVVSAVVRRIKAEMKGIRSHHDDSILLDTIEAVKNFSWETVMLEVQTLPKLLWALNGLDHTTSSVFASSYRIPQTGCTSNTVPSIQLTKGSA